MKAFVIREAGGPEQLKLSELPTPTAKPGWVVIRVRAFGLNRSEWFTRRGESPTVKFPRILGIECVGEIAESLNPSLKVGQKVAALMGGMGRQFDGSYAEYTCVPESIVLPVTTSLEWSKFGALPEMLQTTHGSLHQALEIKPGETLLVRGGTSSIGLCALDLARSFGLKVISTSRSEDKISFLKERGAHDVIVDRGEISPEIRKQYPDGIDRALELVGAHTLLDTIKVLKRGGVACMTGAVGNQWSIKDFHPMGDIPTAVKLTSYSGEAADLNRRDFESYIRMAENGNLQVPSATTFQFEQLPDAHRLMDSNKANGKIVVVS